MGTIEAHIQQASNRTMNFPGHAVSCQAVGTAKTVCGRAVQARHLRGFISGMLLLLLAGCASPPVARRTTQLPTPAVRKTVLPPLPPITTNSVKRQAMLRRAPAVVAVSGGITAVVPPVECASHGPVYVTTNFIPHEVRFLAADYNLKAGKTYQFEVSENLRTWHSVVDPYFAPADEVYTRSINFYVNGYYYPKQFARMRVLP